MHRRCISGNSAVQKKMGRYSVREEKSKFLHSYHCLGKENFNADARCFISLENKNKRASNYDISLFLFIF